MILLVYVVQCSSYHGNLQFLSCDCISQRPQCNSILHLLAAWLFDASLVGVKLHPSHAAPAKERRTSSFIESKHSSLSMDLASHQSRGSAYQYQAGRAEACGALARIFCAHKTGEFILPEYYSRFYIVMYYGLQTDEVGDACLHYASLHVLVP